MFAEGIDAIVETHRRVAQNYFDDGSVEFACPPLKALLNIMAHGHYNGAGIDDPAFRNLFTRDSLLASDSYRARLEAKQRVDQALWARHIAALNAFSTEGGTGIDLPSRPASTHPLILRTHRHHRRRPVASPLKNAFRLQADLRFSPASLAQRCHLHRVSFRLRLRDL